MDGINLKKSNKNIITYNEIFRNSLDGVKFARSFSNIAYCNKIVLNGKEGFNLSKSDGNQLLENYLIMNAKNGFNLTDSEGNIIQKNDVVLNGNWVADTKPWENFYFNNFWVVGANVLYFDIDGDFIGDVGIIPFPDSDYDGYPYTIPIACGAPPELEILKDPWTPEDPPWTPGGSRDNETVTGDPAPPGNGTIEPGNETAHDWNKTDSGNETVTPGNETTHDWNKTDSGNETESSGNETDNDGISTGILGNETGQEGSQIDKSFIALSVKGIGFLTIPKDIQLGSRNRSFHSS
jgi:parallel beta-helix repeat protein